MSDSPAQRPRRRPAGSAEIPPGPNAGRVWRDQTAAHCDPLTGRIVTRLTSYRGHSHHVAGAPPCWREGARQLVIVSDREGCGNLFIYDFPTAALTQLTDLRGDERPTGIRFTAASRLLFAYGANCYELELDSLRMKESRSHLAPPIPPPATGLCAGETLVPGHGRMVWLAADPASRVHHALALTGGSGLAPYALAAPSVRPGHEEVIFVSDATGYAQIYAVDASAVATLPPLESLKRARSPAGGGSGLRPRWPQA